MEDRIQNAEQVYSFPSKFGIDEYVHLQFLNEVPPLLAIVNAVHFTISKVKYDLGIILNPRDFDNPESTIEMTRIYNVDSYFVREYQFPSPL